MPDPNPQPASRHACPPARPPAGTQGPGIPFRPVLIALLAAGVLLIATVVSVARVRQTARHTIDQEVRANLARLAITVGATIDAQAHARLTEPWQEHTPLYQTLNNPLRRVLDQTDGVRFAYTLREQGPDLVFVLDGTPIGDTDNDGVEDHSFLMEVYEDPDPAARIALQTGTVTLTAKPYTDAWGTFLSAFAPVRGPDGTADAVVGLDVDMDEYSRRLALVDRAALWGLLPGAIISALAGVGVWWAARRLLAHAREIERHRANAERANRAKSALLANISHELRTPLTAIKGFVEIAEDRLSDGAARVDALTTVRNNANHLLVLINDLLEMSRIEAGAIVIEPVVADPREVVRTAVAPLALRARAKGIALDVHGMDRLPPAAVIDPTRLRQILLNLLGNAVKFTERGSVQLTVEAADGRMVFSVKDSGPGMDRAQMDLLFMPFSQVGGTAAKRREGTGLGLAISQHLAGLMGSETAMRGWLAEAGLALPGLVLENGAGLSRIERISAGGLAALLVDAYRSPVMAELMASLPVAGVDGTATRRKGASGVAHLKTGLLNDVRAIAGYVLADSGRRYVVVAIVNDARAGGAQAAHDALLEWVRREG